jgi:hypothetical protein
MQYDNDATTDAVSTLEYIGTCEEIAEAGLGDGFSIRVIDGMPEHESEFVPAPGLRTAALEDDLAAVVALRPLACFA